MKFLYTRKEVDEAIHNALVKHETEQYMESRFKSIEKELCNLKELNARSYDDLADRLFNLEMDKKRKVCSCANKNDEQTGD